MAVVMAMPADNVPDLEDIDPDVRAALRFVPVDRVDTVLAQALEPRRDPGALEALPPHAGPAAGCEMPAIRQ